MIIVEKLVSYFFLFLVIIFSLLFLKSANFTIPLEITNTTKTTEFSIVGQGKVEVVPDTFYISAGIVVNNAPTSTEAQIKISEINNKIIVSVKALGIKETEVKTSNYNINPRYNYQTGESTISGYNGSASVEIKVKDKNLAGKVVTSVTNAGANDVRISRSVVDNPEKYREEAREKAIANAKEQAEKLSKSLGLKLGRIVNMVESSPYNPNYSNYGYAESKILLAPGGGAIAPDLEAGTETISSTVTLYFEKK